jgi:uncharacterized Fe-S cluster-containing protein
MIQNKKVTGLQRITPNISIETWKLLNKICYMQNRSQSVVVQDLIEAKRKKFENIVDNIR